MIAVALCAAIAVSPAAAQTHCAVWIDTLLDTSDSCAAEPWRERAMGIQNLRWKGHDYIIFNRGNELAIYNIDNPVEPVLTAESEYKFGNRGDSDYDLLDFEVCDNCRYGIFSHKVKGTVIFDLGNGGAPTLGSSAYSSIPTADLSAGGYTFQEDGLQYLVSSTYPEDCGIFGTGLYAVNGLSQPGFIECVEIGGAPVFVKGLHSYEAGNELYLYMSDSAGQAHIFRADGTGAALTLVHVGSPSNLNARPYALEFDMNNARAASGRAEIVVSETTVWSVSAPSSPQLQWTLPLAAETVSLRSPSADSAATLFTSDRGDFGSERAYTVDGGGPVELFDASFWSDRDLPHNQMPGCVFPVASALSPDSSVLYLSRNAILQVFDLSECLAPTPATAALTLTPSSVYPGESVTISDGSTGRIDRWAIWVTEEPSGALVAGTAVPSDTDPDPIDFVVPPDIAAATSYQAHIVVESDTLTPDVPSADEWIGIDRAPTVAISVVPETVVLGESVTLQATVSGGSPTAYQWEIWAPGAVTPDTRTGATVSSLPLPTAGQWTFKVAATYAHEASAGVPYEATHELQFDVTSVAADFSISPSSPLHTQVITLDGSLSRPAGGDLSYAWLVESPLHNYNGCGDAAQCTILAESLNPDTTYTITLTVTNNADHAASTKTHQVFVGDGNVHPTISVSPTSPHVGQIVIFTVNGVPGDIDSASWSMGGPACDGGDSTPECTPSLWNDCKTLSYKYSAAGEMIVSLTVVVEGGTFPAPDLTVTVASSGSCDGGGCTYELSSTTDESSYEGGSGSFDVNTSAECEWTATTSSPWITIVSPIELVTGGGTVSYWVDANDGPDRADGIVAAGLSFAVTQTSPPTFVDGFESGDTTAWSKAVP